ARRGQQVTDKRCRRKVEARFGVVRHTTPHGRFGVRRASRKSGNRGRRRAFRGGDGVRANGRKRRWSRSAKHDTLRYALAGPGNLDVALPFLDSGSGRRNFVFAGVDRYGRANEPRIDDLSVPPYLVGAYVSIGDHHDLEARELALQRARPGFRELDAILVRVLARQIAGLTVRAPGARGAAHFLVAVAEIDERRKARIEAVAGLELGARVRVLPLFH